MNSLNVYLSDINKAFKGIFIGYTDIIFLEYFANTYQLQYIDENR